MASLQRLKTLEEKLSSAYTDRVKVYPQDDDMVFFEADLFSALRLFITGNVFMLERNLTHDEQEQKKRIAEENIRSVWDEITIGNGTGLKSFNEINFSPLAGNDFLRRFAPAELETLRAMKSAFDETSGYDEVVGFIDGKYFQITNAAKIGARTAEYLKIMEEIQQRLESEET